MRDWVICEIVQQQQPTLIRFFLERGTIPSLYGLTLASPHVEGDKVKEIKDK